MYCTLYSTSRSIPELKPQVYLVSYAFLDQTPAVNEECDLAECGNPELMDDKQAQPLASCSDLGEIYSVEPIQ